MTPEMFPWAVDRAAHLKRRVVPDLPFVQTPHAPIDLAPLHLALDSYITQPGNRHLISMARRQLAIVHAATDDGNLPCQWREMHLFAAILLNAREWHPVLG
jgi:hypothetical protein